MSYNDYYTDDELSEYEIIENWSAFFNPQVKRDSKNRITPIFIDKKIFNIESDPLFNSDYNELTFCNCYFSTGIGFRNASFKGKVTFLNCNIEGSIYTKGSTTFEQGLHIQDSNVHSVAISKGNLDTSSWSLKKVNDISISGGTFRNLDILLKDQVHQFKIEANRVDGELFIDGGKNNLVENLNISGTARDLSIFIHGIKLKNLLIGLFVNEKRFKLSNISTNDHQGKIIITNSQLGKTEFSTIDLNEFNHVIFDETTLVDCTFNNIVWSKNIYGSLPPTLMKPTNSSDIEYSLRSRESFRQLKYAMSKQGDVINEQKFHSLEMGMYFETLRWGKDFWTKSIIFLSWLTSDFGQSIWRPLAFLFSLHTIIFLILLSFSIFPDFKFSTTEFSEVAFGKGINYYFFLINPIRPFDKELFSGGLIIIDLIMRISSSYMIYNVVRASRRFIK